MSKEQELTGRQKLCRRLARVRRYHKQAVRWLFDVSRLTAMYRDDDLGWRGGPLSELADVAKQDYDDAIREVIQTRALIDRALNKLKEYDENERHIRESE
jgi:hypothetical protein